MWHGSLQDWAIANLLAAVEKWVFSEQLPVWQYPGCVLWASEDHMHHPQAEVLKERSVHLSWEQLTCLEEGVRFLWSVKLKHAKFLKRFICIGYFLPLLGSGEPAQWPKEQPDDWLWSVPLARIWKEQPCSYVLQGNSNNIATIDISAGFVGLDTYMEIPATFLTVFGTYVGPVLWASHLMHFLSSETNK